VLRESENLGLSMSEISKISELKEFLLRNEVHLKEEEPSPVEGEGKYGESPEEDEGKRDRHLNRSSR